MEFWVLILTLWAFYVWVRSRTRRQKEDERFANVINALNRLEPRLRDLTKLETRVAELEHRLATPGSAATTATPVQPPVAAAPPKPPTPKPVELPPPVPLPPAPEIPKPPAPPPPASP
ncbi:MAG TPA: hypothetical protein VLX60_09270, partial [Terriglobales bacterium]|nr:hypothetical protein [Terriglobales bacterium]